MTDSSSAHTPTPSPNAKVRQFTLSQRDNLSSDKTSQFSRVICNQLIELLSAKKIPKTQSNQSFVAIYLAIKNEVDLSFFINWAFDHSISLCAPVIQKKYGLMDFFVYHPDSALQANRLNIKEPLIKANQIESQKVAKNQIGIAIFPLSAFDQSGSRIGMGGGYYDRYFKDCAAKRIGVAFEVQKIEQGKIISQPHDLRLDALVSEQRIYRF